MKNLLNKNLILIFAVIALVLSFSLANSVSARTVTVDFGASSEFDQNNNNNNSGNNNNNSGNNNNNNSNQNSSLVPVITSISPTSGITKTGAKTLTINGYNFIPSSVARWNGSDRSTSYVSSSQLLMRATDADMSGLGAYSITVYNHTSNGGVSNTAYYTLKTAPASSSTTKPKPSSTAKPKPASTTPACVTETTDEGNNSNLTASAIFSSDTFLPTSFLGWLLLLILILLIVLVWRKINRSKEKYKATPLKHA